MGDKCDLPLDSIPINQVTKEIPRNDMIWSKQGQPIRLLVAFVW